jgi:hypothetical protein
VHTPTNHNTARPQGSHFFLMTLEVPGYASFTTDGTFTPPAGATRQDVYTHLRDYVTEDKPDMRGANVTYFLLEPNHL